jgi:hypothetical protein
MTDSDLLAKTMREIIICAVKEWMAVDNAWIEEQVGKKDDYETLDEYYDALLDFMVEDQDKLDFLFNPNSLDWFDPIDDYFVKKGIDYENLLDKHLMLDDMPDYFKERCEIDENTPFEDVIRNAVLYYSGVNDVFDWYNVDVNNNDVWFE